MIRCVPSPALPAIPDSVPACPEARPRVSAIVLNRDGADHLRHLFQSMLPEVAAWLHEIIVVDHGSRDDSVAVCADWSDRLPLRCVAFARNHSFSWSNNRAAERASGDYLLLLNNDVRFHDNPLPAMLAAAQATGGAVGAGQQHVASDGTPDGAPHIGVRLTWDPGARALRPKEAIPGPCDAGRRDGLAAMPAVTASCLVVSRERYRQLGGLAEGYDYGYEDVDFVLRLVLGVGLPVASLNGLDLRHQEGGTRRRRNTWTRARRIQRNRRHFRKRWAYPAWRWWRRAVLADPGGMLGRPLAVRLAVDPLGLPDYGFDGPTMAGWRGAASDQASEVVIAAEPGDTYFAGGDLPRLATIACLTRRDAAVWRDRPAALHALDLVVVADPAMRDELLEAGAPAAATRRKVSDKGWLACAAAAARVGIVAPGGPRGSRVIAAARELASAGHPVRIARSARALTPWADVFVHAWPSPFRGGPCGAPWVRLGRLETLASRVSAADSAARRGPGQDALPDLTGQAFPDG